jgi:O-antigen/teichoic acid export membrane protein
MSLKKTTLEGFIWNFLDTFLINGFTFVALILIARRIGPEEFGLIGIIAIFIAVGNSLIDGGLSSSLIRTKEVDNIDYSTIFFTNILISVFIYILIYFSAPFIATFFNQLVLLQIIRVYCLVFIISGFSSVQLAIFNKEMKFKLIMLINIPSKIVGICIGIYTGYNGFGVWSIVFMYISTQTLSTILLWLTSHWKPSLVFSKKKLKMHYHFGYKLLISSLLDRIFHNVYNIIIGKFFPIATLGLFERAKKFTDYPSSTLTSVISKVTYPMLVLLRDDKKKIAIIYRKLLRITFFVTGPLLLGLAAVAEPMFKIVLGENWVGAIPFFQILCLSAMFYPIHSFNINILKVYGRSDWFLKLELIKKVIAVLVLIIGFQFGIFGIVWSSVFTSLIALFINSTYSSRLINYSINKQFSDMIPICTLSFITFVLMYMIVFYMKIYSYNNTSQLIISLFVGFLFYLGVNYSIRKSPIYDLIEIIKNRKL